MALTDNDRLQEFVLLVGDKTSLVDKKWWYALLAAFIAIVPVYYLAKAGFVALALQNYKSPQIIYSDQPKQPLQIKASGVFDLGNNSYTGYAKIVNIEHDWGVSDQTYTAEFKTFGGTVVGTVSRSTYILPSSEKLIVFSISNPDKKPDQVVVSLAPTHFIHKPDVQFDFSLERQTVQNLSNGLVVSAGIKNMTPFTITKVDLPVAVFDNKGQMVAVNYTYISDLESSETRSFQYPWPSAIPGGATLRSEITPQIDIFDRNIFQVAPGVSPF